MSSGSSGHIPMAQLSITAVQGPSLTSFREPVSVTNAAWKWNVIHFNKVHLARCTMTRSQQLTQHRFSVLQFCGPEVWHRCHEAKHQSGGTIDVLGFWRRMLPCSVWHEQDPGLTAVGLKSPFSHQQLAEGFSVSQLWLLTCCRLLQQEIESHSGFGAFLLAPLWGEECSTSGDSCGWLHWATRVAQANWVF